MLEIVEKNLTLLDKIDINPVIESILSILGQNLHIFKEILQPIIIYLEFPLQYHSTNHDDNLYLSLVNCISSLKGKEKKENVITSLKNLLQLEVLYLQHFGQRMNEDDIMTMKQINDDLLK